MTANDTNNGLANELTQAINELESSLRRTAEAATRIKELVPRVAAVNALLDQLETVIRSGREHFGAAEPETATYSRPTLVIPNSGGHAPTAWTPEPQPETAEESPVGGTIGTEPEEARQQPGEETLISFRLEFTSQPGPLDLRAVDEAVGEHPAVRDVALLDYDGRHATLKVWIAASTSPGDVQRTLQERTPELFGEENEIAIVALEEAA